MGGGCFASENVCDGKEHVEVRSSVQTTCLMRNVDVSLYYKLKYFSVCSPNDVFSLCSRMKSKL